MNALEASASDDVVERPDLYGSWRIVKAKAVLIDADGTRTETNSSPKGVLLFTPSHRMIAFVTLDPERKPATNDDEAAKLFRSMIAYTGRFKLHQDRYVVDIDISSTELNMHQGQVRYYTISGDTLTIETPEHSYIGDSSKRNSAVLVCARET
jgi:hypothetical protein